MKKGKAVERALKKADLKYEFFESVRAKLRRRLKPSEPMSRLKVLNEETESLLVELVAAFSVHANPLAAMEVRVLAKVLGDLDEVPSDGWLRKLLARHGSKVKLRTARKSHKQSVLLGLFSALFEWTDETAKVLAGIALCAWLCFNIDETRAIPASKARSVIASAALTQVQYEEALRSTLYTLVGC